MATDARTPTRYLVASWIGQIFAFVVFGIWRLVFAVMAGAFTFLLARDGHPAWALLAIPALPLVLHLLWMPKPGRAVLHLYGRGVGGVWRLTPETWRQSLAADLERHRVARARAKAKALARAEARQPDAASGVESAIIGVGRVIMAGALWLGGSALFLALAYGAFQLVAGLPISVAVIAGAVIIAVAIAAR